MTAVLALFAPFNISDTIHGICPNLLSAVLAAFASPSPALQPSLVPDLACPAVQVS